MTVPCQKTMNYNNDHTKVQVAFYYDDDHEDANPFMDVYMTTYPNFRIGDTIWLTQEVTLYNAIPAIKNLSHTRFKIVDVQHSIYQEINKDYVMTIIKVEVVVRKVK